MDILEYLTQIIEDALKFIHPVYLVVFMAVTYGLRNGLHALLSGFFPAIKSKQWSVLIIGSVVAIPFWVNGDSKMQLFVTYAIGTSLHDLLFVYAEKFLRSLFKAKD